MDSDAEVGQRMQDAFETRGFVALRALLNAEEVALLQRDAQKLHEGLEDSGGDLLTEACMLDPVPDGIPECHPARTDFDEYVRLRQARHSSADTAAFRTLCLSKLPAVPHHTTGVGLLPAVLRRVVLLRAVVVLPRRRPRPRRLSGRDADPS